MENKSNKELLRSLGISPANKYYYLNIIIFINVDSVHVYTFFL